MGRKKKPVLRLTLFFIAVVVASGSILAYLSINNISNLKELTEKRVEEDQENLALAVSGQIEEITNDLAHEFSDYLESNNTSPVTQLRFLDTLKLVEQVFVIDRDRKFVLPWFIEGIETHIQNVPSRDYQAYFDLAERAEFIEKDYGRARIKYLSSLIASANKFDSVQTLNALARLLVKEENGPQAFIYYASIISKYPSVCDPYGFPYVYYAIPQLIRIANPSMRNAVLQELGSCLSGMESGKIPLNRSTLDLLKLVSDWIESWSSPQDSILYITESIQILEKRLSFIDRNREVIRESLAPNIGDELPLVIGNYRALNGNLSEDSELILINLDEGVARGFSIDIWQLWDSISKKDRNAGTEFEYALELVLVENGVYTAENHLATSFNFSPYFPEFQLLVKLANETLIDEFIIRRSWIYGIALTLLLGGMILGILLILRDISREKHLSELRADFISNVTHELKTPLTSIQLFTESITMNRIKSAAQKREYLQIILKETENLKRMINNILDFSRKEKGRREFDFKAVDISTLLLGAIDDLEYWLVEKNFTLIKEINNDIVAKADPVALKQAIINLLNNAIKFSVDRKEIVVRLRKENEQILIQVEDKGIGIPDDQKELIFQAFYRVGQKNSQDISGTGLGLSVVKEIVEAHQGKIIVDSQLNEGSTFTILVNVNHENKT